MGVNIIPQYLGRVGMVRRSMYQFQSKLPVLNSVDDVFSNPNVLMGKNFAAAAPILQGYVNWEYGVLKKGRNVGKGFTMNEKMQNGKLGQKYIQFHPGSKHHYDGKPYWKVSRGTLGVQHVPAFWP